MYMADLEIPKSFYVSGSSLLPTCESDKDILDDPRGLVYIWEPPISHAKYIMSCDPTVGITGWDRQNRIEGDHKTDNGAIEIFHVDAYKRPLLKDGKVVINERTKEPETVWVDLQVCEFFAPVDAVEIARIANVLGRIYAGNEEDQCEFIFESYPGPGMLTNQELIRLGYANLWQWETIGGGSAETTNFTGWRSWGESQRLLWYRARRHLLERRAHIQSPWLLNEYRNAVRDADTMRAKAAYGSHDDLLQAASMAFWAGHKWTYEVERTDEPVTSVPDIDWQARAPVLGEHKSYRESWDDLVDGWG
jgi:hypothetical protein